VTKLDVSKVDKKDQENDLAALTKDVDLLKQQVDDNLAKSLTIERFIDKYLPVSI
jgi:hypothetical protein